MNPISHTPNSDEPFIAAWLISYVVYRVNRYDEIEAAPL